MALYPGSRPCVGCGYCCRQAQCMVGIRVYGAATPCPGLVRVQRPLVQAGYQYRCKLVLDEQERGDEKAALVLCIGEGCCSPLNSDRQRFAGPA